MIKTPTTKAQIMKVLDDIQRLTSLAQAALQFGKPTTAEAELDLLTQYARALEDRPPGAVNA